MVIYRRSPIWPFCSAIVCDKVYRFAGAGRIGVRGDKFKYSMAFFRNIARFPCRDAILLLSYGVMSVARKNCARHIATVGNKRLKLPMLETAQPTSGKKANLVLGRGGPGNTFPYHEIIREAWLISPRKRIFAKSGDVSANRNAIR